ncbi:alpha/beta hydrolase family protein [Streptomyces sp. NRRL F-5126]|uniref:alpha/beta hydrolase family protein n=1 Tax=Streptomyces sp. NRRL F-5126 TaxID=1463857 RepID=UPI00099D2D3A|nr:prolyl oligopeptidase family serine peptidase [Streptomyces sp. NRRL F-5126]
MTTPNPDPTNSTPAQKLLAAQWRSMTPARMFDYGMLPDDIARMRTMTAEGAAWDVAAESLADDQERRALGALRDGHRVTAVEAYRAAVADLVFAQMAFNDDTPRKHRIYDRLSSMLSTVSGLLGDRFEKVELGFGSRHLVGWLVRPPEGEARGTVVVFGGQSGWGAAYWRHADALAARGLATIMAEGPGQGETRLRHGVLLDVDIPAAYSRYVDFVHENPSLGSATGVFGNSLGGLYAALTAAADRRVRACCVNGAPARPSLLGHRSFDEQAAAMLGTDDPDRIAANFRRLAFDPRRAHIDCPLLVLHGGHDVLFELQAQQPFLDGTRDGADRTLRVWPDGDHTVYNHCQERTSFVADWFADMLARG